MKHSIRWLLMTLCAVACALLLTLTALAAPSAKEAQSARGCKSHPGPLLTLADLSETAAKRNSGPMRAPSLDPAVTDLPLAVIVVGFNDLPYNDGFDWGSAVFRRDSSLAEFYSDMSLGQFTFTPARESSAFGVSGNTNAADAADDGVIHVNVDLPHSDWRLEDAYMSKKDILANRTLLEAFTAALEAAGDQIDFAAYDANEDGAITTDELAVGFVVAGYEAASSVSYEHGNSAYLWSHAWSLDELIRDYGFDAQTPVIGGVKVSSYIAIAETDDTDVQNSTSVLAHELGHYLGLPDLYETNYNTSHEWGKYDVGCLSLMCMDAWSTPTEEGEWIPCPLDAWCRVALGWVTPETAGDSGVYTVSAQNYAENDSYSVLRIPTQNPEEYYLVENRVPDKWNAPMTEEFDTENGGLLFWHVDDAVMEKGLLDNTVNNAGHHPGLTALFPETASDGSLAFIGANKKVQTSAPFFDSAVWTETFSALGDTLDLPLYGTGADAGLRSGRTLSGIKTAFLTDAGPEMRLELNPEDHAHHPVLVTVTAPTCTGTGLGYYECPLCGLHFTDATGTVETADPVTIPALGHTAANGQGQCARCGEQLIPADQICPYCHQYHDGSFLQRIVSFLHRILYFFAHLFGRM